MVKISKLIIVFLVVFGFNLVAQETDKGKFVKKENKFYKNHLKTMNEYFDKIEKTPKKKSFVLDLKGKKFPAILADYKTQWHNPVESQGSSGMCWSFSTVSFLESEMYRIHKKKIKLSQLYVVYCEYIEKAMGYVQTRGKSLFAEGSEGNAVTKDIKKYGIIPYKIYSGLPSGQPNHDHRRLYREMKTFLKSIKKSNNWNPEYVKATIKSILNHHIGTPPTSFKWKGKTYTPLSFYKNYVKLDMDNYVEIMSYMQQPYYKQVEYEVPDNWWHDKSYYNIPLDEYMTIIKRLVKEGYTLSIGGDVSEPGYNAIAEVGIVPDFDIPSKYINENSRQFRFSNKTTTDDHGIHIVGYQIVEGKYWFVIKDSGSGARNGKNVGYRFIHEDYVKLKWMGFTIHKDAVKDILKKVK